MSLSKKHYEAVADILRAVRSADLPTRDNGKASAILAADFAITDIEDRLAAYFQDDNPSFDPGRFRRAAQP